MVAKVLGRFIGILSVAIASLATLADCAMAQPVDFAARGPARQLAQMRRNPYVEQDDSPVYETSQAPEKVDDPLRGIDSFDTAPMPSEPGTPASPPPGEPLDMGGLDNQPPAAGEKPGEGSAEQGAKSNKSPSSAGGEKPPIDLLPSGAEEVPTGAIVSNEDLGAGLLEPYTYEPPAPVCSSGTWLNRGCWYAQSDFVYLARLNNHHDVLVLADDVSALRVESLRTHTGLGYSPGTRLTVGHFLGRDAKNRDHSFEFTYYGLFDWSDARGIMAVNPASTNLIFSRVTPVVVGEYAGFNNVLSQLYEYTSDMDSYELNWRITRRLGRDRMELSRNGEWVRKSTPDHLPSIFGGLRFLTVNEGFNYISTNADPTTRSGLYAIRTHNDLIGLQMGTDLFFQQRSWKLGARAKGGAFVDFADEISHLQVTDTNPANVFPQPNPRDEKDSRNFGSFVGEVNLMGTYQIRPNMAFRASYDFMWINQVALAPLQMHFQQFPNAATVTLNNGGSIFYTGASIGFEMVW